VRRGACGSVSLAPGGDVTPAAAFRRGGLSCVRGRHAAGGWSDALRARRVGDQAQAGSLPLVYRRYI
jgi:hypothetical protein